MVDFNIFNQAVRVLKNNNLQNVNDALESVHAHRELALETQQREMEELKRMFISYKKYLNQIDFQKQSIEFKDIQPWIPVLKRHQQTSVYEDLKASTVAKIINAKKEQSEMNNSLDDFKIRMLEQARKVKSSANNSEKIELQIFILEVAADIEEYFSPLGYKPQEMADYELKKFFEMYRRKGGVTLDG